MAALHRRALMGSLPDLASCYPSCGGIADADHACGGVADTDQACGGVADTDQAWTAIQAALAAGPIELPRTVQTNEVTRSCALVPGFLEIAKRTRLPLRLLEIGCSAGLNLRWDHFRYEASGGAWGDPASPVVFPNAWEGDVALDAHVEVAERRGCDLAPVELDENGRLTLLSFVWPELRDRFVRLDRAIEIARQVPAVLHACDAVTFLEQRLAEPAPGVATVVFHSIVWLYLSSESQKRIEEIMDAAGQRATSENPLAWLRMENSPDHEAQAEVHLTSWPGKQYFKIATAGFHGKDVRVASPRPSITL